MYNKATSLLFVISSLLFFSTAGLAQKQEQINWLSFAQLEDSLRITPKKVFIDFYADWCGPCLKMQKVAFRDPEVVKLINAEFYAVKMDVETRDTIYFGQQMFVNKRWKKRNPIHEIPLLMASRKDAPFTLPALVFLDENFKATGRYFQYLDPRQLLGILQKQPRTVTR
ncbi:Thioredoxin-related protein [Arenibacter nanhaiticus]|uniref:Thioredoxin-related protein n=1 Tax=Arenibacter nanhaiticus TaxID=558155 RepID=A0A1M6AJU3_9FLAO|nr:thioredoxin family protein [Arenibacter nanhaiticus]SHI36608.1 Thioredoxin-related protein [Arenibacter nanhaiticus]